MYHAWEVCSHEGYMGAEVTGTDEISWWGYNHTIAAVDPAECNATNAMLGKDVYITEWPVRDPTDYNGDFNCACLAMRDTSSGPVKGTC